MGQVKVIAKMAQKSYEKSSSIICLKMSLDFVSKCGLSIQILLGAIAYAYLMKKKEYLSVRVLGHQTLTVMLACTQSFL